MAETYDKATKPTKDYSTACLTTLSETISCAFAQPGIIIIPLCFYGAFLVVTIYTIRWGNTIPDDNTILDKCSLLIIKQHHFFFLLNINWTIIKLSYLMVKFSYWFKGSQNVLLHRKVVILWIYYHIHNLPIYLNFITIYESHKRRMVISWLTHHKPVPGFKYVERKPLTRNDDIHDKKRYQINTKVCQAFMLWNPFCIFHWEVLLYDVVKCHTGKKPSEIL